MPQEAESYVHRIGRTGRAGQKGIAITFVTPREMSRLGMIKKVAKADIKKQDVPQIKDIIKAKEEYLQACLGEIIAESDFKSYNGLAKRILGDNDPQAVIAALLRHQYQDEFLEESYAKIEQSRSAVSGDNVKLFVALGKIDGMNPRALLDVLHQSCKTPGRKVRDIRILEKFSFITVPLDEAEIIMRKLNQKNKKMVEVAKS